MLSTKKGIVLALCLGFAWAGSAFAEPSYLVYPANVPTVFRYDVSRFEVIDSDQEKFDPLYAVGNFMLWDRVEGRVPIEIYRAPQLIGFEPTVGPSEFVTYRDDFDIVIDGFGATPRTVGNLCLRFWPEPAQNAAILTIDGVSTDRLTTTLDGFEVTTPTGDGHYSDMRVHHVSWTGAATMKIIAFSDKDGDGRFEGVPAYRITARYTAVSTEATSWGKVKALYRQ